MPGHLTILIAFVLGSTLLLSSGTANTQSGNRPVADEVFRPPAYESLPGTMGKAPEDARPLMGWSAGAARCAATARLGLVADSIDLAHPAFARIRAERKDFRPAGAAAASTSSGTALLALLAGQTDGGVEGLVPEAQFFLVDALFADRAGAPVTDVVTILKSLNWLRARRTQVVLLDLVGPGDVLVQHAITELSQGGTVVVMPAPDREGAHAYADAILVASINRDMQSNTENVQGRADLFAPGTSIWTAQPKRTYEFVSGNSFAAAYVVAAIAATYSSLAVDVAAPERTARVLQQLPVKDIGNGHKLVAAPAGCLASPAVITPVPSGGWMSTIQPK